jgi:hypothetical protein
MHKSELEVLQKMQGKNLLGFPKLIDHGSTNSNKFEIINKVNRNTNSNNIIYFIIMTKLGKNLGNIITQYFPDQGGFSRKTIAQIGIQLVDRL